MIRVGTLPIEVLMKTYCFPAMVDDLRLGECDEDEGCEFEWFS